MTDIKKGIMDIDPDSTLIDDSTNSDIETLRKKLELIKEKETEEILLKRRELLKEKFITEILKQPELLLDIKNIKLPDTYEKQFQDFLSINDISWNEESNNKSVTTNNENKSFIEGSKINDNEENKDNKKKEKQNDINGSILTVNNDIENENDVNNENTTSTNQSTTIRIRHIKIVKKLPPQKTKIPTGRTKSRPVNIPFNIPIKKSERVEDWVLWKNKVKQQPLARAIQGSHKILTTNDWEIVYEELKQYKKIERYEALKAAKQLSFRQIKKFKAPPRTKTHWDHLLEEMRWLYEDFKEERKWKKALAYKLVHWVYEWHQSDDKESLCIKVKRDKNNRVIVREHITSDQNKGEDKEKSSNNNKDKSVFTNNTNYEVEKDTLKDSSKDIIKIKIEENGKQIDSTKNKTNENKDESVNNNSIVEEKQVNTIKPPDRKSVV